MHSRGRRRNQKYIMSITWYNLKDFYMKIWDTPLEQQDILQDRQSILRNVYFNKSAQNPGTDLVRMDWLGAKNTWVRKEFDIWVLKMILLYSLTERYHEFLCKTNVFLQFTVYHMLELHKCFSLFSFLLFPSLPSLSFPNPSLSSLSFLFIFLPFPSFPLSLSFYIITVETDRQFSACGICSFRYSRRQTGRVFINVNSETEMTGLEFNCATYYCFILNTDVMLTKWVMTCKYSECWI